MNNSSRNANSGDSSNPLIDIAQKDVDGVLKLFDTSLSGLTETEAQRRLAKSGLNEIAREKPSKWYIQLLRTMTNPLSILLIALGVISLLTGSATAGFIILSHHVFPEAWCKQQGIPATRYNCLLNRTPLKRDTNRFIGSQPPSVYLARLVDEQGISRRGLDEILRSHYIEPKTLWNDDFEAFLDSRMEDLSLLIEEMMGINLSKVNLVEAR